MVLILHFSIAMPSPDDRLRELDSRITVDYCQAVDLNAYFRVCRSMLVMAKMQETDDQLFKAYCLERRFVVLFIDHLSKREDYKRCEQKLKLFWSRECKRALGHVEQLRAQILARFKEEELATNRALVEQQQKAREAAVAAVVAPSQTVPTDVPAKAINGTAPSPPAFDRSLKPTLGPKVNGFNPIHVPRTLAATFLLIAEPNSRQNKETCATLCGRLGGMSGSDLIVSHIVFCKQSGTPDSCVTTNEEELLQCMDDHSLIALGWIHTHPTQTVFMSSLDLHCQLSYQLMLPESIAIVCSPKYNDVQYFSLTPDYGVKFLRDCRQTGFHRHTSTRDLYTKSPHVVFNDTTIEVIDLR